MIHLTSCRMLYGDRLWVQTPKFDKYSGNSHELKFAMKSLPFPCLIRALKLLRKAKLAPGISVARTAESCSKRQKLLKNRDRPTPQSLKMYTPSLQLLDQLFENSHLQGSL